MALCYQQQSCTEAFIPSFAYLSDTHHPLSTLSPSLVFGFSPLLLGCNIPQPLEEGTNMWFTPESIGFPPSLLLVSTLPRRKAQKLRFTRNSIGFLSLSSDTHNTPVRYPLHNFHTSPVYFCPPSSRRAISRLATRPGYRARCSLFSARARNGTLHLFTTTPPPCEHGDMYRVQVLFCPITPSPISGIRFEEGIYSGTMSTAIPCLPRYL